MPSLIMYHPSIEYLHLGTSVVFEERAEIVNALVRSVLLGPLLALWLVSILIIVPNWLGVALPAYFGHSEWGRRS